MELLFKLDFKRSLTWTCCKCRYINSFFVVIIAPTHVYLVILLGLFRTLRHFIDDMMLYLVEERLARIYRDEGPKHQHQPQPSHQSQTQATASGSSSGTGALPPHTNEDTPSTTAVAQPEPSTVEMEISSNDSP